METTICNKPIGQKVLDAGFKRVTDSDLYQMLHCDEIAEMENKIIEQDFIAEVNKQIQKLPSKYHDKAREMLSESLKNAKNKRRYLLIENFYPPEKPLSVVDELFVMFKCLANDYSCLKKQMEGRIYILRDMVWCIVKKEPLDNFIEDKIPDNILHEINKARDIGIERFEICFPVIEKFKGDPIVIGILGNHQIFIGQW